MILDMTILPPQASDMAWHVDNLIWFIAGVTGVSGLGVYAVLAGFCIVFRKKPNDPLVAKTPRILGSHKLELLWSIVPLFIFLAMFVWGAWVYDKALHAPDDAPELYVVGKQWMWKVQYPGKNGPRVILGVNSGDFPKEVGSDEMFAGEMVLPVGKAVKIITTSEDVIHDFGVPAFRQKIDVIPGRYTSTWYKPTKTGVYHIYCDQYCGTNHSLMVGKLRVVEQAEYDAWHEGWWQATPDRHAPNGTLADQGRQLFQKLGCIQCHEAEKSRAPLLEEIFRTQRLIKGGKPAYGDENYLRESIRKPRAKVREGWEPIMPAFGPDKLNEEDLIRVIAYIKSLKRGQTPIRMNTEPAPVGAPTETPTSGGTQP